MAPQSFTDVNKGDLFGDLDVLANSKKPVIAAVNGFALGGGKFFK
jgi:enoyl-CoA hydratase